MAVCNLGSVNVSAHLDEAGNLDHEKLKETVTTTIRMLGSRGVELAEVRGDGMQRKR